jgi:hypothetical protein
MPAPWSSAPTNQVPGPVRSSTVNSFDEGGGGGCDGLQATTVIEATMQIRCRRRVRNPTPMHDALIAL